MNRRALLILPCLLFLFVTVTAQRNEANKNAPVKEARGASPGEAEPVTPKRRPKKPLSCYYPPAGFFPDRLKDQPRCFP